jgi:cytochrome c
MSLLRWFFGLIALTTFTPAIAGQDEVELGTKVFVQCQSCHEIGKDAGNGVGPELNGIVNRTIGSVAGFDYSDALADAGKRGETWDKKKLAQFLAGKAKQFSASKMRLVPAVADPKNRDAVIAMLSSIDSSGKGAPALKRDPDLPPAIASIEGDPEYGEYLAGECSTCHQSDGTNKGIPSITGLSKLAFAKAMNAYRVGARDNPVMQNIAKALGDEEIAALAAHFSKQ